MQASLAVVILLQKRSQRLKQVINLFNRVVIHQANTDHKVGGTLI